MTRNLFLIIIFVLFSGLTGCYIKKPGKPILILATETGFGTYTGEILKTEGFNEFKIDSLTDAKVTLSYLKKFDLVILAESELGLPVKDMLEEFVKSGGNLIAFRPDPAISDMFGISRAGGNINEGYIGIDSSNTGGEGSDNKDIAVSWNR